jgi:hypothetical protein
MSGRIRYEGLNFSEGRAMLFLLFTAGARGNSGVDSCAQYSDTDCETCLGNLDNITCGFCLNGRGCSQGDINGSINSSSQCYFNSSQSGAVSLDWIFVNDGRCKKDSSIAFSRPVRIAIGVVSGTIGVVTFVFWFWIFPKLMTLKQEDHQLMYKYDPMG